MNPAGQAAVDLRLKPGTAAIDEGEILPGFNDNYAGKAPDLGAYEFGAALPHYGPRAQRRSHREHRLVERTAPANRGSGRQVRGLGRDSADTSGPRREWIPPGR